MILNNEFSIALILSLVGLGVISLIVFLIFFLVKQSRLNMYVKGKIIDKDSGVIGGVVAGTGSIASYYTLTIQEDLGKIKRLNVSRGLYEQFKVGDKIAKKKGEEFPSKMNS